MMNITRRELSQAIFGTAIIPAGKSPRDVKQPEMVQKIRENLLHRLKGQCFDHLRDWTGTADLYFLVETLLDFEMNGTGDIRLNPPELGLPEAFLRQIGREVPCFVAVPEHLQKAVQEYVRVLVRANAARR